MRLSRHLATLLLLIPAAALAQTAEPPYRPGLNPADENPQPVKTRCWNGSTSKWEACAAAGSGGPSTVLRSIYYADVANGALAANASTSPTTRDTGVAAGTAQPWNAFNCFARGDAAGATLLSQASVDGSTWFVTQSIAMSVAATPYTTRIPVFYRYNRCLVANGSTGQTALTIASSYGE